MTSEGSTPTGEEGSPPTVGVAPSGGVALARQLIERLTVLETQFMDVQREDAELKIRIEKRPDEQKLPGQNAKTSSVDARFIGKPDSFDGKDESWPSSSMVVRAYLAAIDPRLPELIKMAENPVEEVDNISLTPEDERLSCQLYYILTMLCKGRAQDKVSLVKDTEGLLLRRYLTDEYEPWFRSRSTCLAQKILAYTVGSDVMPSLEKFET